MREIPCSLPKSRSSEIRCELTTFSFRAGVVVLGAVLGVSYRNHTDVFCPFAFHAEEPEVHVRIPEWAPLVARHSSGPDDTGCVALDVNR
jgi:hypothetical protein